MEKINSLIEAEAKKISHGCYTISASQFYFGYKEASEKWANIAVGFSKYCFENGYEGRNSEEQLFHYLTKILPNNG